MGLKRLEVKARRLTDRTLDMAAAGDRRTLERQVLSDDVLPADDKALAHSAAELQSAAKKEKKRRDLEKPFDFSKLPPEKLCDFIKMRRQPKTHGPGVYWVVYSYDGTMLATCGHDKRISIRNGEDGSVIRSCKGHHGWVLQCHWSPDDQKILSCAASEICIWDVYTAKLLQLVETHHNGLVNSCHWAWWPAGQTNAAQRKSNTTYICSASNDMSVRLWEVKAKGPGSGRVRERFVEEYQANGKVIRSICHQGEPLLLMATSTGEISLWDAFDHNGVSDIDYIAHDDSVLGLAWSWGARTKIFASCSQDETVRVWHREREQPMWIFEGHTSAVFTVAWGPEAKCREDPIGRLFSCGHDATVRIWDAAVGVCLAKLKTDHASWVTAVTIKPDGMHMGTSSMHERTSLVLYDVVPPVPTAEDFKQVIAAKGEVLSERLEPVLELLDEMGRVGRGIKAIGRMFQRKPKLTRKGRAK